MHGLHFLQGERALFLGSHRNCFAWIDEWFGMTMKVISELEQRTVSSLNEVKIHFNFDIYVSRKQRKNLKSAKLLYICTHLTLLQNFASYILPLFHS